MRAGMRPPKSQTPMRAFLPLSPLRPRESRSKRRRVGGRIDAARPPGGRIDDVRPPGDRKASVAGTSRRKCSAPCIAAARTISI